MKSISRHAFVRAFTALLALSALPPIVFADRPAKRPNVLFILADDQHHHTIRALGNRAIETPNLDRLVRRGTTFTSAYIMGGSSPAVCSPSRAALMTGRTLWNLENQGLWGFEISEKYQTLPEAFRAAGYNTFGTGKNEPGLKGGSFKRGFSHGEKILFAGNSDHYRLRLSNLKPDGTYEREVINDRHSSEVYADATIDFVKQQAESNKPFFAYVAFQAPHDPWQAPEEYLVRYTPDEMPVPAAFMPRHPFDNGELQIRDERNAPWPRTKEKVQQITAKYYAMITHLDAQIGRIFEALETTGQLADTIIVFSSDNGMAVGSHGLLGKQNVYEPTVKVPLVMAGPGVPANRVCDRLVYIYDIHPTLCEMIGIKTPETVQFKSFKPLILDNDAPHREHLYFAYMKWQRAVRDKQHKLIEYCVNGKRHTQLFDLVADPYELHNLAGDAKHAATLERLRKLLEAERVRLNDGNTPHEFTDGQGKEFWATFKSTTESATP